MYDAFKFLHVLGVTLLLGNVTITAFWKVLADMTRDPVVIAHAQRGVGLADWLFTLSGIVLILIGGYGAAWMGEISPLGPRWLIAGEVLFALSGIIWLAVLVPLQIRQARMARAFAAGGIIPARYWRDSRAWLIWGIVATVPLVAALLIMIAKP